MRFGIGLALTLGNKSSSNRSDFYLSYIYQATKGYCDFLVGDICTATSTYEAITKNNVGAVTYTWVVSGAAITAGWGTNIISVTTESGSNDAFTVECVVDDTFTSDGKSTDFIHDRTELVGILTVSQNPLNIPYTPTFLTLVTSPEVLDIPYTPTSGVTTTTAEGEV